MVFFFVQDIRRKYRYFSADSCLSIQVKFSRFKKFWTSAKKKVLKLLPQRILNQEQAFESVLKIPDEQITIIHSGRLESPKIKNKFSFYLHRQRSKHIALLAGEFLLLPITGLAAILPGPNMFFYVLALLVIIQWKAVRGINRLKKKEYLFVASETLREWEDAVYRNEKESFSILLERIEAEHGIPEVHKILSR